MNNNSLNSHPFLKKIETNGNSTEKPNIKIKIIRIFNISTIAFYGIAVFLFFLSFIFFEKLQYRIIIPEFYWTVLAFALFTFLGFIEHIFFLFIKKKKTMRHIEFTVVAISVIIFLVYELIIFTIYQHFDSNFRKFWEKYSDDERIQNIETSLNCCGYDVIESRCRRRSDVTCSSIFNKKYIQQQYPIAFTQMAFTILLFIFLMELFSHTLKSKNKKHHHHHGHKDAEQEQRKVPLSPEEL